MFWQQNLLAAYRVVYLSFLPSFSQARYLHRHIFSRTLHSSSLQPCQLKIFSSKQILLFYPTYIMPQDGKDCSVNYCVSLRFRIMCVLILLLKFWWCSCESCEKCTKATIHLRVGIHCMASDYTLLKWKTIMSFAMPSVSSTEQIQSTKRTQVSWTMILPFRPGFRICFLVQHIFPFSWIQLARYLSSSPSWVIIIVYSYLQSDIWDSEFDRFLVYSAPFISAS